MTWNWNVEDDACAICQIYISDPCLQVTSLITIHEKALFCSVTYPPNVLMQLASVDIRSIYVVFENGN